MIDQCIYIVLKRSVEFLNVADVSTCAIVLIRVSELCTGTVS